MVTPADFATFQQQLRQEVADVIQQLRAEVNEAISGRTDMLNSINAALQNVSARPAESKPCRISDLIPRNWEGSNEKESSGASGRTCTCGCKRGQIKESRCMPALRASTSLTTTRLHLIAQMKSSDQLRHRCIRSYTERQQTSH